VRKTSRGGRGGKKKHINRVEIRGLLKKSSAKQPTKKKFVRGGGPHREEFGAEKIWKKKLSVQLTDTHLHY